MRALGLIGLLLLLLPAPLRADETAPGAPAPGKAAPPKAAPAPAQATLADAHKLAREGAWPRAITMARAVLDREPGNAGAARLLQDLLLATGAEPKVAQEATPELLRRALVARLRSDRKRGADQLTAVLRQTGAPVLFRLDLARALTSLGKVMQAENEVQRHLKVYAKDPAGLTELGLILIARKRKKAAQEALEAALAPDPGLAAPAVALAALLATDNAPEEGRAVLQRALAVYPRNPTLLLGLADDQIRAGEPDLALRTLGSILQLPAEKSAVHARMAEVHRSTKNLVEAERCAKLALAVNAKCVRALRTIGFVQQKKDDLEAALATYEGVAKLAPDWPQIHADVGFVHMLRGKTLFAERALRKALEMDEDLIEARRTLGIVLFQRGRSKLGKKELSVVLKEDKEDLRANRYMGYILLDEGKAKASIKHFAIVARLDPKDADSLRMTGNAYMLMGKAEQAIEAYQEAIGRNKDFGWAYFDMGKALESQGRWEDAAASHRKAIELDPKLCHPHLYLAELLDEILDEPEEALKHYERYLELDGHGEGGWIKKRIQQLERDIEEDKKNEKDKGK